MSIASCSFVTGQHTQIKPAVYVPDTLEDKPTVSLCDDKGVVVRTKDFLDLCLTITPTQKDDKAKSFTCSSLLYRPLGYSNKYMVDEGGDNCMMKMRAFANSKGISITSPIEFSYTLEKDPAGVHNMVGTVAMHLKWTQQDRPVNQLVNRDNVGGSLDGGSPASVAFTVLLAVMTFIF